MAKPDGDQNGTRGIPEVIADDMKAEIAKGKERPKGIKVSMKTYNEIKDAGLIEMKDVAAWGFIGLGYQMPFFDGDIHIFVDPELECDGLDYRLPPCVDA